MIVCVLYLYTVFQLIDSDFPLFTLVVLTCIRFKKVFHGSNLKKLRTCRVCYSPNTEWRQYLFYCLKMCDMSGIKITLKSRQPNGLFHAWISELYTEAREMKSKLEPMLKLALESLSKYPLPLKTGADCKILKGFGEKLCNHLDARLEVYNHNLALSLAQAGGNSCSSPSSTRVSTCDSPLSDINENVNTIPDGMLFIPNSNIPSNDVINSQSFSVSNVTSNNELAVNSQDNGVSDASNHSESPHPSNVANKKKLMSKKYKPAYRSGAYALLLTLLEESQDNPGAMSLTKEELIEKAQKHAEESFVRPKPNTHYTAWSGMSKLVATGLVKKVRNKKVKFQLTAEGVDMAKELLEDQKNTPTANDIIFNSVTSSCYVSLERNDDIMNKEVANSQKNHFEIELPAGTFDIILLIDKNETGGLSKKNDPTMAQFKKYNDLKHEYRSLKVGDFTWIAQHKIHKDRELVLPYVVERKRMDDLGASIKDGRFHEQKFRLRKCGVDHIIYLVENYGNNKNVGLPIKHLHQALANTRVQDRFKVHITDSLTNSVRYLAMMTKRITVRYKDKNLKGRSANAGLEHQLMTFEYFNQASVKSKVLTVTETFIKILLQLKGVSVEKALAITDKYSTPSSLIIAYQKCDRKEGESLLAHLKYGELGRNVGPAVSKSIYKLFSNTGAE